MRTHSGAYVVQPKESEVRWMGAIATHFLATGDLTHGAFALVEEESERGVAVPLHRHTHDAESFYVLDGEISFFVDDQPPVRGTAGTFAHIPGGSVHGFRIESETARYLILTTPLHGEFYRAISLPSVRAEIDDSVIEAACREYGIEFIGPLPE